MSNTPSDARIWELIPDDWTMTVTLGFTIENRAGIDVLVWKDGGADQQQAQRLLCGKRSQQFNSQLCGSR